MQIDFLNDEDDGLLHALGQFDIDPVVNVFVQVVDVVELSLQE